MNQLKYPTNYQQTVLPFTNYMTFDNSSLNPYNYKSFGERENIYQQYQDMYYYTRQINPMSTINNNPQTRDPSNIPCDVALGGYTVPIGEYYKGEGRKVMKSMKDRYGEKRGKEVFYATANKRGMNRPGKKRASKRG